MSKPQLAMPSTTQAKIVTAVSVGESSSSNIRLQGNPQTTDLDWEDACLDLHQTALEEGKVEGREAGMQAGFRDGRELGQSKGLEFGIEIGFYEGILKDLQERLQATTTPAENQNDNDTVPNQIVFTDRIRKNLRQLELAIEDFPSSDELFAPSNNTSSAIAGFRTETTEDFQETQEGDSERRIDVLHKLQRIRARFKLLMVQLGHPQFSLKQVLEDPRSVSGTSSDDTTTDVKGKKESKTSTLPTNEW